MFKKAERKKAWLKLAITGPSGSGKTLSALYLAQGMSKKIAVIDTENGSASLYSDKIPSFDVTEIDPPYRIEKYCAAIDGAVKAGYEILVIDSISHAWAGEGGLLQQKEEADARGGKNDKNKFANWGPVTKSHETFKAWLLKCDIHLIVTMRSKQEYVIGEGNKPVKVGLAPIQREGMEYEFTAVLDMAMNHTAKASKDRTGLFGEDIFQPSPEVGVKLMAWLNNDATGKALPSAEKPLDEISMVRVRLAKLFEVAWFDELKQKKFYEWCRVNPLNASLLQLQNVEQALKEHLEKKTMKALGSPDDLAAAAAESVVER